MCRGQRIKRGQRRRHLEECMYHFTKWYVTNSPTLLFFSPPTSLVSLSLSLAILHNLAMVSTTSSVPPPPSIRSRRSFSRFHVRFDLGAYFCDEPRLAHETVTTYCILTYRSLSYHSYSCLFHPFVSIIPKYFPAVLKTSNVFVPKLSR